MNTTAGPAPVKVFISYSHEDQEFQDSLVQHLAVLARENRIVIWHDGQINAGSKWESRIESELAAAGMILFLVSSSFISSEFSQSKELAAALERQAKEGIPIVPIVLRPVAWSRSPLAGFQALPTGTKPVSLWSDRDAAFTNIVEGIRRTLDSDGRPALFGQLPGRPRRMSWAGTLSIAAFLTFVTGAIFYVVLPAGPLDAGGFLVVFAWWALVSVAANYLLQRLRFMRHLSPNRTKGAQ